MEYLKTEFKTLASSRPWIFFKIAARNGPPIIKARYTDDRLITLNVSRMSASEISKEIKDLVDSRGVQVKITTPVKPHIFSKSEYWNPFLSSNKFRP